MKRLLPLTALLLCGFGCAHTASQRDTWSTLQIQSPSQGTLSPAFLVHVAQEYLQAQQLVVDQSSPILDICVGSPDRIAIVKFWQGEERMVAVEIGPEGTALRHQEIKIAK